MRKLRLSSLARQDVISITAHIASDSPSAASKWIERLFAMFETLRKRPGLGRTREDLASNLRSFPIGEYLITYRVRRQEIEVVRLLHGRRDLRKLF